MVPVMEEWNEGGRRVRVGTCRRTWCEVGGWMRGRSRLRGLLGSSTDECRSRGREKRL